MIFVGDNVREPGQAGAIAHEDEFDVPYASWSDPSVDHPALYEGSVPRSVPATVIVDRHWRVPVIVNGETNVRELTVLLDVLVAEP